MLVGFDAYQLEVELVCQIMKIRCHFSVDSVGIQCKNGIFTDISML
ncbi:MAG: hypothetical protein HRU09_15235 [Oligoflexales bacterium]|nr:hypothetical protein [Oligoflexales bacterium]